MVRADIDTGQDFEYSYASSTQTLTAVTAVPEPSSPLLLGSGLMGLAGWRWRKARAATS